MFFPFYSENVQNVSSIFFFIFYWLPQYLVHIAHLIDINSYKAWCFWTVVLKKTLESPLDCKEIQPVHFKGNQSWVSYGRTNAKAETPILWPPHAKSWLIGKGIGGRRKRGRQRTRWLDGIIDSMDTQVWVNSGSWWWTGRPGMLRFMGSQSDTT